VLPTPVDREAPLEAILYILLALFGLLFGSFANVVIWRFPRGESLSHPGSHCPVCDSPIAWYDNVPVLSWIALLGRCRSCGTQISPRYPAVELLSSVLWVLAGVVFGLSLQSALAVFFFYLLLILSFIDIDLRRLPNTLVGLLFAVGLAGVLVSQFTPLRALPLLSAGGRLLAEPLVFAVVGAAASAGLMLAIALGYERLRHKQGLGMGDIKLLAVMGLYLGAYALLALFFATICGALYGLAAARFSREGGRQAFPFGPFLAVGSVATVTFGPTVWNWYLALLH
jgi:leader peptidase (prepilin peptidase)/N-methyltransferase